MTQLMTIIMTSIRLDVLFGQLGTGLDTNKKKSKIGSKEKQSQTLKSEDEMLISIIESDNENKIIYVREVDADALGGDVLPGSLADWTDKQIIDWANENWCAPEDDSDFSGFEIERLSCAPSQLTKKENDNETL